jgi:hypothetical protein
MNTALNQLIEVELERPEIGNVAVTDDNLIVDLKDGRTIIAPLLWYPRLAYATEAERQAFEVKRNVIFWPCLDEEISVRSMLLGRSSGESSQSLERWLAERSRNGSAGAVPKEDPWDN